MDLITAVVKKDINALRNLLLAGADPNATEDKDSVTLLHHAVASRSLDAVKLLLLAGANTTIKNADGLTALDLAKRLKLKKMMSLFKVFGFNG